MSELTDFVDHLDRPVYCLLGLPVDRVSKDEAIDILRAAAASKLRFLLSTPNVNFAIASLDDRTLRDCILLSDLCPLDGMPLVWVARFLGLPFRERVSGSDIFLSLKTNAAAAPLSVCFFGGAANVAHRACANLNRAAGGLVCRGGIDPGWQPIEEMSCASLLEQINGSHADFLVAALGARKGQAWLLRNHMAIEVPIRAHLGAVMNFEAGTVKRAPAWLRRWGLEWLWRIKEEPQLWKRYWNDGLVLSRLLTLNVLPLSLLGCGFRLWSKARPAPLSMDFRTPAGRLDVSLEGDATERWAPSAAGRLKKTLKPGFTSVQVDLSKVRVIDQRFLGLLLMLRRSASQQGAGFCCIGASPFVRWLFRLNCCEYLLGDVISTAGKPNMVVFQS